MLQGLQAVHLRHHHVQKDRAVVLRRRRDLLQSDPTVFRFLHLVIGRENIVQDAAVDRVVIHDQQRLRGDVWDIPYGLFHLATLSFARSRPVPLQKGKQSARAAPKKGPLVSVIAAALSAVMRSFLIYYIKNSFFYNILTLTVCI